MRRYCITDSLEVAARAAREDVDLIQIRAKELSGRALTELVRLEAECCAWMTFAMAVSPDGIQLTITSDGEDGERGVREAFAPLAR